MESNLDPMKTPDPSNGLSSQSTDWILRYLRGELSSLNRMRFELEVNRNHKLREELDEISHVLEAFDHESRVHPSEDGDLKSKLLDEIPEASWQSSKALRARALRFKPSRILLLVALCAMGIWGVLSLDLGSNSPFFSKPAPMITPVKSTEESSLSEFQKSLKLAHQWLIKAQDLDGGWSAKKWGGYSESRVGVSSLALLALLKSEVEESHAAIRKGISFLQGQQRESDGLLGRDQVGSLYDHSVATLALLEAQRRGFKGIETHSRNALSYLRNQQRRSGGWESLKRRNSVPDTSISLWALRVLSFGQSEGWKGLEESKEKGESFVHAVQRFKKIQNPHSNDRLNSLVLLLNSSQDLNSKEVRGAVDALSRDIGRQASMSFHDSYFYSLALSRVQKNSWANKLRVELRKNLVSKQIEKGDSCGSWEPTGSYEHAGGRVMSTALASLSLQARY